MTTLQPTPDELARQSIRERLEHIEANLVPVRERIAALTRQLAEAQMVEAALHAEAAQLAEHPALTHL